MLFAALLFGGHVVDRAWLLQAKEYHDCAGYLVEPHWQLKGGMLRPLELHMTEEFSQKWTEIAALIAQAKGDRGRSGAIMVGTSLRSRWTVVTTHEDVRQEKRALILCKDAEQAEKLMEKQKKLRAEVDELAKKVRELKKQKPHTPISLSAYSVKLKKTRAKVRNGTAISPEEFVSTFLSMCTLAR